MRHGCPMALASTKLPLLLIRSPSRRRLCHSLAERLRTVTAGKNLVLDRLFSLSGPPAAVGNVGVGTDSTAAAVGQTQLNPSVSGSVLIQTADGGTARSSQTVTIASTFGTGVANFAWNEYGLFNGNTNGTSTMFNRVVIGPFTKTSAVSIVLQAQITQS